jgi:hypothetical protein
MPDTMPALAVRKSVTVEAPAAHAFEVFTIGFDSWWPRGHHIARVDHPSVCPCTESAWAPVRRGPLSEIDPVSSIRSARSAVALRRRAG